MRRLVIAFSLVSAGALAQPRDVPSGPAEVIRSAREAAERSRQDSNLEQGAERTVPPEVLRRAAGRMPPIAQAAADASVDAGTILVSVVDAMNQPVAGATVRIGVMKADGSRESIVRQTDERGQLRASELPTGSSQAYRVNVVNDGATYSSTPFRLEPDRGHRVQIRILPVTRSRRSLLQTLGQTMLEYRNERVHITEQAQLTNLGEETIVFDDDELRIDLPAGFTAFQSQPGMTDQRLVPDEHGFVLRGSLPPGRATLVWAYDIPLRGDELHFSHPIPFRTYAYRVMSDAMGGMELVVDGFPEAQEHEGHQGRPLLVTQVERSPDDPPLERLSVTVKGIPAPGPLRWLALGAALVLLAFGLLMATRGGDRAGALARARAARQTELIDEAVELEELFAAREIGPQYRERRMRELVDELASLLRLDEATAASRSARSAKERRKPRTKRA